MDDIAGAVRAIVHRAPDWIKQELIAKDPALRERAEESLAAMIAAALSEQAENP